MQNAKRKITNKSKTLICHCEEGFRRSNLKLILRRDCGACPERSEGSYLFLAMLVIRKNQEQGCG